MFVVQIWWEGWHDGLAQNLTHLSHISIPECVKFCLTITHGPCTETTILVLFFIMLYSIASTENDIKDNAWKFFGPKHMFSSKIPLSHSSSLSPKHIHTFTHFTNQNHSHRIISHLSHVKERGVLRWFI